MRKLCTVQYILACVGGDKRVFIEIKLLFYATRARNVIRLNFYCFMKCEMTIMFGLISKNAKSTKVVPGVGHVATKQFVVNFRIFPASFQIFNGFSKISA